MTLGEKLLALRKKEGLSQEEVAEKLGVSRQTVSKWETGQTVPELIKARLLSQLYNVRYDYLIGESDVPPDITGMDALADEIDWTSAWSKKYPVLAEYPARDGMDGQMAQVSAFYDNLMERYGFSHLDAFLVLKDMVYQKYKHSKQSRA